MMPKSTATMAPSWSMNRLPGCRSAWKKPSRNTCLKKAAAAFSQIARTSSPAASSAARSSMRMPRDPLQGQHLARGAAPIDARHAKARIAGEILAELRGRGRLEAQIHLDAHRSAPRSRPPRRGLRRRKRGCERSASCGEPEEEVEIAGEGRRDAGAQHLDRDLARPRCVTREMDLGDRGGCDRRSSSKRAEEFAERLAEIALDGGARLRAGKRRQTVLQLRQIGGDVLADEIGAGGERLAELDEARAQRLQRARQGAGPAGPRGRRRAGATAAQQRQPAPRPSTRSSGKSAS